MALGSATVARKGTGCYIAAMTKHSIEILLERVASWPEEAQDEFVKSLAEIERKHAGIYKLSDEERAAVRRGLSDMRAGRLASDEAVSSLFRRYGA
jgi:hypothetical protein